MEKISLGLTKATLEEIGFVIQEFLEKNRCPQISIEDRYHIIAVDVEHNRMPDTAIECIDLVGKIIPNDITIDDVPVLPRSILKQDGTAIDIHALPIARISPQSRYHKGNYLDITFWIWIPGARDYLMGLVSQMRVALDFVTMGAVSKKQSSGGRPRNTDDEWAREQVHDLGRSKKNVFPEWKKRIGNRATILVDPQDAFDKMIRKKPKKGE